MQVILTPAAEQKILYFLQNSQISSGFLLGKRISRFIIITDLLPANFSSDNIENIYTSTYEIYKDKLKGFFYRKKKVMINDIFLEKVIMEIDDNKIGFHINRLDHSRETGSVREEIKHIFSKNVNLL